MMRTERSLCLRYFRSLLLIPLPFNQKKKCVSLSRITFIPVRSFFERTRFGNRYDKVEPLDLTPSHVIKESKKILKEETKLFCEEVKEHFRQDPKFYKYGDTDVIFRFDSEECLKNWRVGSDKDYNEGFSECNLFINNNKKAVFQGIVDITVPQTGNIHRAGYCAMKSKRKKKSFYRDDSYDWNVFTHLEMRVKGDGRTYKVILGMNHYFDVTWFDLYTYFLFTHGGPYWQTIRIPFSKFFLTAKGRIQDKQIPFSLSKVDSVGIVCAHTPGPFRLEIDYIGVHKGFKEEDFAYEMYYLPKKIVSW